MTGMSKKAEEELELLTDAAMLPMVEKSIRRGMCYVIHWYAKANNKCMKDYNPSKEFSYLKYRDLMDRQSNKNCPVGGSEWRKDKFTFDEKFIQNCDEDSDKEYILEVNFNRPKTFIIERERAVTSANEQ